MAFHICSNKMAGTLLSNSESNLLTLRKMLRIAIDSSDSAPCGGGQ